MFRVLLCVMCFPSSEALKAMFEKFEQLTGFDEVFFDLRVRKYNRTSAVLNGTITLNVWEGDDVKLSLDLFHSRLGNQQYNHYPMKLPTCGACEFIDNMHDNYKEQMDTIENVPAKGECPMAPRTIVLRDRTFPTEVIPLVMPRGLWKAVVTGVKDGKKILSYYLMVKGYDDY